MNGPYTNQCLQTWWTEAGCTASVPTNAWWNTQSQQTVKDDMKLWAKTEDQASVSACYGKSLIEKYPTTVDSKGCVSKWYYGENNNIINTCGSPDGDMPWCMYPVYRSGSPSWSWKYTNDPHDPQCLRNWKYYDSSGKVIQNNISSITTLNDTKSWCPINRYVPDNTNIGIQAWEYC